MAASTLTSGTKAIPYMPMTVEAIACPAPVLPDDFDNCLIPGGIDMWSRGGFYSPGQCFVGYRAMCTQTAVASDGWPVREEETAVRCIPSSEHTREPDTYWQLTRTREYECNDESKDQKYATTKFDGTVLSAPAFEIRWRAEDLLSRSMDRPGSRVQTLPPPLTTATKASATSSTIRTSNAGPTITELSGSGSKESSHTTLSPGSIAGVAVGGGMGVIALAIIAAYLTLRRRRRHAGATRLSEDSWDRDKFRPGQPPIELDNKPMEPKELSGDSAAVPWAKMDDKGGSQTPYAFNPAVAHISLNEFPVEMAAEPVQGIGKSQNGSI